MMDCTRKIMTTASGKDCNAVCIHRNSKDFLFWVKYVPYKKDYCTNTISNAHRRTSRAAVTLQRANKTSLLTIINKITTAPIELVNSVGCKRHEEEKMVKEKLVKEPEQRRCVEKITANSTTTSNAETILGIDNERAPSGHNEIETCKTLSEQDSEHCRASMAGTTDIKYTEQFRVFFSGASDFNHLPYSFKQVYHINAIHRRPVFLKKRTKNRRRTINNETEVNGELHNPSLEYHIHCRANLKLDVRCDDEFLHFRNCSSSFVTVSDDIDLLSLELVKVVFPYAKQSVFALLCDQSYYPYSTLQYNNSSHILLRPTAFQKITTAGCDDISNEQNYERITTILSQSSFSTVHRDISDTVMFHQLIDGFFSDHTRINFLSKHHIKRSEIGVAIKYVVLRMTTFLSFKLKPNTFASLFPFLLELTHSSVDLFHPSCFLIFFVFSIFLYRLGLVQCSSLNCKCLIMKQKKVDKTKEDLGFLRMPQNIIKHLFNPTNKENCTPRKLPICLYDTLSKYICSIIHVDDDELDTLFSCLWNFCDSRMNYRTPMFLTSISHSNCLFESRTINNYILFGMLIRALNSPGVSILMHESGIYIVSCVKQSSLFFSQNNFHTLCCDLIDSAHHPCRKVRLSIPSCLSVPLYKSTDEGGSHWKFLDAVNDLSNMVNRREDVHLRYISRVLRLLLCRVNVRLLNNLLNVVYCRGKHTVSYLLGKRIVPFVNMLKSLDPGLFDDILSIDFCREYLNLANKRTMHWQCEKLIFRRTGILSRKKFLINMITTFKQLLDHIRLRTFSDPNPTDDIPYYSTSRKQVTVEHHPYNHDFLQFLYSLVESRSVPRSFLSVCGISVSKLVHSLNGNIVFSFLRLPLLCLFFMLMAIPVLPMSTTTQNPESDYSEDSDEVNHVFGDPLYADFRDYTVALPGAIAYKCKSCGIWSPLNLRSNSVKEFIVHKRCNIKEKLRGNADTLLAERLARENIITESERAISQRNIQLMAVRAERDELLKMIDEYAGQIQTLTRPINMVQLRTRNDPALLSQLQMSWFLTNSHQVMGEPNICAVKAEDLIRLNVQIESQAVQISRNVIRISVLEDMIKQLKERLNALHGYSMFNSMPAQAARAERPDATTSDVTTSEFSINLSELTVPNIQATNSNQYMYRASSSRNTEHLQPSPNNHQDSGDTNDNGDVSLHHRTHDELRRRRRKHRSLSKHPYDRNKREYAFADLNGGLLNQTRYYAFCQC